MSDPLKTTWVHYLCAALAFCVTGLPLVWLGTQQRAPRPVYSSPAIDHGPLGSPPDFPMIWLPLEGECYVRVSQPAGGADEIVLPVNLRSADTVVNVRAFVGSPEGGGALGSGSSRWPAENISVRLNRRAAPGEEIVLGLRAEAKNVHESPGLYRALDRPSGGKVSTMWLVSDLDPSINPLLQVRYPLQPGWWCLLPAIIALLLGGTPLGQRTGAARWPLVLALGTAALAGLSVILWQVQYSEWWTHINPDRHLDHARVFADWLRDRELSATSEAFFGRHTYLHLPLMPGLMAVLMWTGLPEFFVYAGITACASCAAVLLFHATAHRVLGMGAGLATLPAGALLLHYRFAKSVAKPSPDMLGLLLACLLLMLVLDRFRKARSWHLPAVAVALFLAALARPQGITYMPLIALFLFAADLRRDGKASFGRAAIRSSLTVAAGVIPYIALYFVFGWDASMERKFTMNEVFAAESRPISHFVSNLKMIYFAPILLVIGLWRKQAGSGELSAAEESRVDHHLAVIALSWIAYHSFVYLVVEAAALSTRIYLPIAPAVALLLVPWIRGLGEGGARWSRGKRWEFALLSSLFLLTTGFMTICHLLEPGYQSTFEDWWFR